MADTKAGAKAPATVTVGGLEITPNADYVKSWEALDLQMQLADPDLGNVEKVRIYMKLVEGMANVSIGQIVDAVGGPSADAVAVVSLAAEIIQAVTPKK